jgi:hypothetical protein
MAFKLKNVTDIHATGVHFDAQAKALVEHILKHWNVSVKPKGYDNFLETYEDYEGMDNIDEDALQAEFNGHDSGFSVCGLPFPVALTKEHVAYDDTNQGRNPLECLVGAIYGYGLQFGQVIESIKPSTDKGRAIEDAIDRISMIKADLAGCKESLEKNDLKNTKDWFYGLEQELKKSFIKLSKFSKSVNSEGDKYVDGYISEWIKEYRDKCDRDNYQI